MTKLIFPQELEVWYVLPAIRKRLALALINKGKSQKDVARLMYVTEATISQYKKEKRAKDNFLGIRFDNEFNKSTNNILKESDLFFPEVMRLNSLIKNSGILCELHKEKTTINLPCQNCELNNGVSM
jgi:predicted transcriptional regulator